MQRWQPDSWQHKPCKQAVAYPDQQHYADVIGQLMALPPLVTHSEIGALQQRLAAASRGECFILQGGDCAESFAQCNSSNITNKLKILLQMSLVLLHGMRKPIIRVGRIAGQYAKPRSSDYETIDGVTLPSYRGDLINAPGFTETSRRPNPDLMLKGYSCAALTLNYIRALLEGGFADLQHPDGWDLDFVGYSAQAEQYDHIVNSITDAIDFLQVIDGVQSSHLQRVEFFTSHEALHLPYEQALTRQIDDGRWFNFSTHFPWLGMRTADLDGAHIEYCRGIHNPIAVKVGPAATRDWLMGLIETLNPDNQPGRLMLISRLGADNVERLLPPLIEAQQASGIEVLWSCDPMHGNTQSTSEGFKTRHFENILGELRQTFACHRQHHSHLGGVHFELTGENVTECIGGARGLTEQDLRRAYHSLVDPRLNYEQALEMALLLVQEGRDAV